MLKHKILDFFLFILVVAAGAFFFKFVRGNLALEEQVNLQAFQANSLIEEVGQTKEENRILFEKLQRAELELESLKQKTSESFVEVSPAMSEAPKIARPQMLPPLPESKNFLIVGQHKKLADTIMIASVHAQTQKITLISIPRDLSVNGRKLNEYLSLYGPESLRQKVEMVSSLPMHHMILLDFGAFESIIDALGGIDISVEKSIYDALYPDGKGGYTVYSIAAGLHHLNGAEALKYARSRHSTSDFDRAKRQQQILLAIRERVLNFDFLSDVGKLKTIFGAVSGSVETDLSLDEIIAHAQSLSHFSLESGQVISTENFLSSSVNINGQYILLPRGGNWGKIQRYIRELLAK